MNNNPLFEDTLALIQQMLKVIAVCELEKENIDVGDAGYNNQRVLISSLFKDGYNIGKIILRLIVIDSLYSTNASYSYFSFDEMARSIYELGADVDDEVSKRLCAADYFYRVATTGVDDKGLFSKNYGIQKNLSEGSKQMSLMSKYAYYELLQTPERYPLGFPIYDRLAKNAYPTVCRMLGLDKYWSMPSLDTPSISLYIACISQLREAIFDNDELFENKYQQFDILDAYLWRMGKFSDGNLSLLLGLDDYKVFINNLDLARREAETDEEYRKRLLDEQTLILNSEGKSETADKYDFNSIIRHRLSSDSTVFQGVKNEKYMNSLLEHWKCFISSDKLAPRRGTKYPEQ